MSHKSSTDYWTRALLALQDSGVLDDLDCSQGWASTRRVIKIMIGLLGQIWQCPGFWHPVCRGPLQQRRTGQCPEDRLAERLCRVQRRLRVGIFPPQIGS